MPTLDRIVAMLKANADLNITIEGHTDSTSTPGTISSSLSGAQWRSNSI